MGEEHPGDRSRIVCIVHGRGMTHMEAPPLLESEEAFYQGRKQDLWDL